ncbi:MAG: AMP-binding protein [Acidimicrobiia bacterium]|nr:AMP-binding protein [Acidimicrobiia bacterium]
MSTQAGTTPRTLTAALLATATTHPDRPAVVRGEDQAVTWQELVERALAVGAALNHFRVEGLPFHVGILADNVPEWPELVYGAFLAGAGVVGLNTTRRGTELARDIAHTSCSVVVAQDQYATQVPAGTDVPILSLGPACAAAVDAASTLAAEPITQPEDVAFLLLTSGSTSSPKAVIRTHGAAVASGAKMVGRLGLDARDVGYISMPLFHGGAIMTVFVPALLTGAAIGLRARFSVSEFLGDVRRLRATWWGYTGKPLAYLLTSPVRPDDADNPLRVVIGNEGSSHNCDRFAARFGCEVIDFYGSTEGGVGLVRTSTDPPGVLGRLPEGVKVLSPSGTECPSAELDPHGRLVNADVAIGEIVNTAGTQMFEGYWQNPDATAERTRDGAYHSGDLGYVDSAGFLHFAGRMDDWVRVDGENFATAAVVRLLESHPDVVTAAVVAVPDEAAGDQLLAVVELDRDSDLDAAGLVSWMSAQPDCGTKWPPRYVRFVSTMPLAATHKVDVARLRREGVLAPGVVVRSGDEFAPVDVAALRARLATTGRAHLLDIGT